LGGWVKPRTWGFTRHFLASEKKASHWRVAPHYAVLADGHQNSGQHDSTTTAMSGARLLPPNEIVGSTHPPNQPTNPPEWEWATTLQK